MQLFVALLGFLAVTPATGIADILKAWPNFKLKHKKHYTDDREQQYRFNAYSINRKRIDEHNQRYLLNLTNFLLKENYYSDYYDSDFNSKMLGYRPLEDVAGFFTNGSDFGATFITPENVQIPENMDWRNKNAVTPVEDQNGCASCWAFSATGALESQHFLKTGNLTPLSVQNLLDCTYEMGYDGCIGGNMKNAFEYVAENRGIDTASSYPYEAQKLECEFKEDHVGAICPCFMMLPDSNENLLKEAVATKGPVSVALMGNLDTFRHYSRDVYDDPECNGNTLNHAALVVGYGTTPDGRDYWILKNSWGTSWGIEGYMYLARNQNNICGVASSPIYPLV